MTAFTVIAAVLFPVAFGFFASFIIGKVRNVAKHGDGPSEPENITKNKPEN